jgi:hypothetical protein
MLVSRVVKSVATIEVWDVQPVISLTATRAITRVEILTSTKKRRGICLSTVFRGPERQRWWFQGESIQESQWSPVTPVTIGASELG